MTQPGPVVTVVSCNQVESLFRSSVTIRVVVAFRIFMPGEETLPLRVWPSVMFTNANFGGGGAGGVGAGGAGGVTGAGGGVADGGDGGVVGGGAAGGGVMTPRV
jgi:hypothetical protein